MSSHSSHWVSRKFVKFLCASATLIVICLAIFVTVASCLVVKPIDFIAPNVSPIMANISFTTEVISADATSRTLVMDWYPQITINCDLNPSLVSDIFLDPNLLDSSSPSFSSLPPFRSAYQFNSSAFCTGASGITPIFRTVSKLLTSEVDLPRNPSRSTLQNYPFDVYFARLSLFALNNKTRSFVPLNVTLSFGVAVDFEVTLRRSSAPPSRLDIYLQVERSKATKAFVVIVAITNWLVAVASLIISAATLVYKDHRYYSEMFMLPVGALFAFTSIRANLPGAPAGFGATIDLYTILPVLVILTLCSFFLLLAILYRRIRDQAHVHHPPARSLTLHENKSILSKPGPPSVVESVEHNSMVGRNKALPDLPTDTADLV